MIGEGIKLQIVGVDGRQVRIGVDAPREIPVHREEIYDRIRNERDDGKSP